MAEDKETDMKAPFEDNPDFNSDKEEKETAGKAPEKRTPYRDAPFSSYKNSKPTDVSLPAEDGKSETAEVLKEERAFLKQDERFLLHGENYSPEERKSDRAYYLKDEKKDRDPGKFVFLTVVLCIVCAFIGGATGAFLTRKTKTDVIKPDSTVATTVVNAQNNNNGDRVGAGIFGKTVQNRTTHPENVVAVRPNGEAQKKPDTLNGPMSAKDIYLSCVRSVVKIESTGLSGNKSCGSGFIFRSDGYVLTNYHVIEKGADYMVTFCDTTALGARLIGFDSQNDIAVLKVEADNLPYASLGDSSRLMVGEDVYIIGNPLGDLTFTMTSGIVSALNRLIKIPGGTINMFQTNAAINNGNSGGPVFNENGEVVGVATAKYGAATIEGLGFCIPINDIKSMMKEIVDKGYVSGRAMLGITARDSVSVNAFFFKTTIDIKGAKVTSVKNGSAAQKAGIRTQDIIVALGKSEVTSISSLNTAMTLLRAGDETTVTVVRNSKKIKLNIRLDEYRPFKNENTDDYVI